MACDRCDESHIAGYKFCMSCVEPLNSCANCERAREESFSFCSPCSKPLAEPRKPSSTLSMFGVYIAPVVAILLIAELIVVFTGVSETWTAAKEMSMSVLVLKPELAVAGEISGTTLLVFWIVLYCASQRQWPSCRFRPSLRSGRGG